MNKHVMIVCADQSNVSSISNRIRKPFLKRGWQVSVFNYRLWQMHRFNITKTLLNNALVNETLRIHPDLVLVFKGESLNEGVINKISNLGVKTACWTMDDPFGEFNSFNEIKTRNEFNYFFVFDSFYIQKLKETGQPNSYWLPCCVDPEIHNEQMDWYTREEKYDLSFIGSHCQKREKTMNDLISYSPQIWGYRWNTVRGELKKHISSIVYKADKSLEDTKMTCMIYNKTKVNINPHAMQSINGMNLRTFEVPATKSFQLVEYHNDLPNLFEIGKEIISYNSIEEAKYLINYYLENNGLREQIANAGYERVIKDHTFDNRIQTMLEVMNI